MLLVLGDVDPGEFEAAKQLRSAAVPNVEVLQGTLASISLLFV
jgi:hypothetical protein